MPKYTTLDDYMAMKDGDAAPDDVIVETEADETPETPETQDPAPADAAAEGDTTLEAPAGETSAPTPEQVSEAARVLSQQKQETKREKRIRQINEEIAAYTAKKSTVKAEADAEEARLTSLRAQRTQFEAAPKAQAPAPAAPAAKPAAPVRPVAPKPEDVGTVAIPDWDAFQAKQSQFVADTAEYATAEARRVAEESIAAERRRLENESEHRAWMGRVDALRAEYPDFDQVVFQNPDLHIGEKLAQEIVKDTDPAGGRVAHYLGTHVQESHRIARLPESAQLAEYGRLKFVVTMPQVPSSKTTSPAPSAKPVSKTPVPVPLVGVASVSTQVPTERLTLAEYTAKRNAEEDRNGRL